MRISGEDAVMERETHQGRVDGGPGTGPRGWQTAQNDRNDPHDGHAGDGCPWESPQGVERRLGMTTTTLYTYINGDGSLKEPDQRLLDEHSSAIAFRSSSRKQGVK
jgi:hypothetical protein